MGNGAHNARHQRTYRARRKEEKVSLQREVARLMARTKDLELRVLLLTSRLKWEGAAKVWAENAQLWSLLPLEKRLEWLAAKQLESLKND